MLNLRKKLLMGNQQEFLQDFQNLEFDLQNFYNKRQITEQIFNCKIQQRNQPFQRSVKRPYQSTIDISNIIQNRHFNSPKSSFKINQFTYQIEPRQSFQKNAEDEELQKFIKELFLLKPQIKIQNLFWPPYLQRMRIKNKLLPQMLNQQLQSADKSKPFKIYPVSYFLPFGLMERSGVYPRKTAFNELPIKQQLKLLYPQSKQKLIVKQEKQQSIQKSQDQTPPNWKQEFLQNLYQFQDCDFSQLKKGQEISKIQQDFNIIYSDNESVELIIEKEQCQCSKCYILSSNWNDIFGCQFTKLFDEHFDLSQGPFFDQNFDQIQVFQLKITLNDLVDESVQKLFGYGQSSIKQIQSKIQEIKQIHIDQDDSKSLREAQLLKKQQLYFQKNKIVQKFLGNIFQDYPPQSIDQYLILHKLKVKIHDFEANYYPKCPTPFKKTNPIYFTPNIDEVTGRLYYLKKIKHIKKRELKCQMKNDIKEINLWSQIKLIKQKLQINKSIVNSKQTIHSQQVENQQSISQNSCCSQSIQEIL